MIESVTLLEHCLWVSRTAVVNWSGVSVSVSVVGTEAVVDQVDVAEVSVVVVVTVVVAAVFGVTSSRSARLVVGVTV
jgi:hypothetical protein